MTDKFSQPTIHKEKQTKILGLYETIPPDIPLIERMKETLSLIPAGPIITTNDSLLMARDNYAYFIAADCNLSFPISRQLTDLGYINEIILREQKPRKGSVIVSQCGRMKFFGLVCRDRYFDQLTDDAIYAAIHGLKKAMIESNCSTVRISRIDGTRE